MHDAERLQKEDEALFELSEELERFRTRLVRDFKSEKSLEESIKNYEERINALRSIQKKWTGMILPQRPGKVVAREMDDLSIKDAVAILNGRVTYSKKEPVRIKNYKVPPGEYSLDPQHQDDLMPDPSSISFSITRDRKTYNFNGGQINLDGRPLSRFIELLNPLVDKPSHAVLNEARKTFWHHAAIKIHNNLLTRERQMHDYMKSCNVAVASWKFRGAELQKYMVACNDSASALKSRADSLEHERQRLLKRLHDLELANGKLETRRVTMFNNFSKSAAWGCAPEGEPIIRATVSFSAAAAKVAANANAPQGEQSYTQQKTGNRHAPKP